MFNSTNADLTAATPTSLPTTLARRGFGTRMRLLAVGAVMVAAAASAVSVQAQDHPGGRMGGHHGGGGMMMFSGSPERVGRMVDHLLDGVNASDAQRAQIKQIATAAATDLKAQREAGHGLREKGMQLLTAPVIDANAAEVLRRQMLEQHDVTSKRALQAMLDVSAVLTPEQRAKVAERMQKRRTGMLDRLRGHTG